MSTDEALFEFLSALNKDEQFLKMNHVRIDVAKAMGSDGTDYGDWEIVVKRTRVPSSETES